MRELIKEHWEAVVGAFATLLSIILALFWLITQNEYLEPLMEILTAITAFLVFFISFKVIIKQSNIRTFSQEFNHQLEKFWIDFGALVKEKGEHDGNIDFLDNKRNVIEIAHDTNLVLKSDYPKLKNDMYFDLFEFPDELNFGSEIRYFVNTKLLSKRALIENTTEVQVARLIAAQIAYKVNETFLDFAAEATDFDETSAIVTIKLRRKMTSARDAKEIVDLFRYLLILQLALV